MPSIPLDPAAAGLTLAYTATDNAVLKYATDHLACFSKLFGFPSFRINLGVAKTRHNAFLHSSADARFVFCIWV